MMCIPFGKETVTLIRRTETVSASGKKQASYEKVMLYNCSWMRTVKEFQNDGVRTFSESVTVRVPAGQTRPETGDMMIYGTYSGTITSGADFQNVIEHMRRSGGAFVVQGVSDNTANGCPMPHYKAVGA